MPGFFQRTLHLCAAYCFVSTIPLSAATLPLNQAEEANQSIEEILVWGESQRADRTGYMSPTSLLTQADMGTINTVTTEDLVKFEPSLVIRRRFIGDSNGTLGIRGSNMFQTSRSMVFADGVPLHYLLQSRWNGAPRWTLVSASEIAQIEVLYGPFSAEYSGNAMGGVVLIETAIPQKETLHVDGAYFIQDFEAYGFDDNVDGFKGFASYGNKWGNTSFYASYNHLDNTSQPQSFRDSGNASSDENSTATTVTGGIIGNDAQGRSKIWYGDTGVVDTTTDNLKIKVGHDFGNWQSLANIAYENRTSSNTGQSYLKDEADNTIWSRDHLLQDGREFSANLRRGRHGSRLNSNELNRQSVSLGLRVRGQTSDQATLEFNINHFAILEDERLSSRRNPNDPLFTLAGQVTDYDNSGWSTAEAKLRLDDFIVPGLQWLSGIRHERYALNLDVYTSQNYRAGTKDTVTSRFGGETQISALYNQVNWAITDQWDASIGLRYESFKSHDGHFDNDDDTTAEFDITQIPSEKKEAFSPKFSLGYQPSTWQFRYSIAKAFRFPIVEELFSQYRSYNTVALSNPELEPENGLHHNVMIDKTTAGGYVRINLFQETVKDAIESQTDTLNDIRSFVPIDRVEVKGVEFIAHQEGFLFDALDIRFNLTWTDAKIISNASAESGSDFDPADSIRGNIYPRMPKWRSNLLATYHLTPAWDFSVSAQYASDSFGRITNDDQENNVFGAQDAFTRLGLKTTYRFNTQWQASLGIDNVTNDIDYVAHPWPGRTAYINFAFDL